LELKQKFTGITYTSTQYPSTTLAILLIKKKAVYNIYYQVLSATRLWHPGVYRAKCILLVNWCRVPVCVLTCCDWY